MKLNSVLYVLVLTSAVSADFTIGVIPDVQYLSQSENGGDMMKTMTQFFLDRKEELNLVHVASLGDMTDDLVVDAQWQRSRSSYDIFPYEEISYSPCQGNHDDIAYLNKWFPVSNFKKYSQFGGYFRGIENAYYLFTADGMDFMILVNQDKNDNSSKDWAHSIYDRYPDRRCIHVNHDIDIDGWVQKDIIEKHDNIFMGLAGHRGENSGERYWTTTSTGGNTQHMLMSNYQGRTNIGAQLRYYTFKPNEDLVCAFTYNVQTQEYEVDETSQFCFHYDMEPYGDGLDHSLKVLSESGGTVTVNPAGNAGTYAFNTPVKLTAHSKKGFQFDRWKGDITGAHNPAVIKMDTDKTITATYKDSSVDKCVDRLAFPISSYGEERLDNGSVIIESDLLDLPRTDDGGDEQAVGLNFGNITLPPGIEIASAYIQFTSQEKEMKNTQVPSMDIWAEAVDNSSPFAAQDNNVSNRQPSTARVNWRPARWKRPFRKGTNQQTPYLTTLVQEILDRPGWKEGNNISFIIQRADDKMGGDKYRLAQTNPEQGPVLVIDYVNKSKSAAVLPASKVMD